MCSKLDFFHNRPQDLRFFARINTSRNFYDRGKGFRCIYFICFFLLSIHHCDSLMHNYGHGRTLEGIYNLRHFSGERLGSDSIRPFQQYTLGESQPLYRYRPYNGHSFLRSSQIHSKPKSSTSERYDHSFAKTSRSDTRLYGSDGQVADIPQVAPYRNYAFSRNNEDRTKFNDSLGNRRNIGIGTFQRSNHRLRWRTPNVLKVPSTPTTSESSPFSPETNNDDTQSEDFGGQTEYTEVKDEVILETYRRRTPCLFSRTDWVRDRTNCSVFFVCARMRIAAVMRCPDARVWSNRVTNCVPSGSRWDDCEQSQVQHDHKYYRRRPRQEIIQRGKTDSPQTTRTVTSEQTTDHPQPVSDSTDQPSYQDQAFSRNRSRRRWRYYENGGRRLMLDRKSNYGGYRVEKLPQTTQKLVFKTRPETEAIDGELRNGIGNDIKKRWLRSSLAPVTPQPSQKTIYDRSKMSTSSHFSLPLYRVSRSEEDVPTKKQLSRPLYQYRRFQDQTNGKEHRLRLMPGTTRPPVNNTGRYDTGRYHESNSDHTVSPARTLWLKHRNKWRLNFAKRRESRAERQPIYRLWTDIPAQSKSTTSNTFSTTVNYFNMAHLTEKLEPVETIRDFEKEGIHIKDIRSTLDRSDSDGGSNDKTIKTPGTKWWIDVVSIVTDPIQTTSTPMTSTTSITTTEMKLPTRALNITTERYIPECGIAMTSMIVGGLPARKRRWPWVVSLQLSWANRHVCGATLVHPQWVITAAHCVAGPDFSSANEWRAVFWQHGSSENIELIIPHPDFVNGDNYPNDIALLRLRKPTDVSGFDLRHACLPIRNPQQDDVWDKCWIMGWGEDKGNTKAQLKELKVNIRKNSECSARWGWKRILNSHVCIGNGDKGACNGDSGGPLICRHDGYHYLAGVTSWGVSGCQTTGYPSVFTRVAFYHDWIQNVLNTYESP